MELTTDDLTLLNINGEIPICFPDLTFKSLLVSLQQENYIYNTEIYKQHETRGHKVNYLLNG